MFIGMLVAEKERKRPRKSQTTNNIKKIGMMEMSRPCRRAKQKRKIGLKTRKEATITNNNPQRYQDSNAYGAWRWCEGPPKDTTTTAQGVKHAQFPK
ncbi:hypothetical protein I7I50_03824 [Histoplasma capsulatum G186AR]|uniref:Uncharacterized protein n=1 Tax=Ajellomyces capsulatus TaxID=5037 RepID=A0A8H7YPX0_AJECA|nr:hypothetical protein I7I52_04732 [Histoplasma capsulatum]QSS74878.1 hypothetical protein I7I50_03824 [Histoplasma capsulatum G186AR]